MDRVEVGWVVLSRVGLGRLKSCVKFLGSGLVGLCRLKDWVRLSSVGFGRVGLSNLN